MKWDWMIIPGADVRIQILLDVLIPVIIVLYFQAGRYHGDDKIAKPRRPIERNPYSWILVCLWIWSFVATLWHVYLSRLHPSRH